jgi:hypothetical protein
VFPVPIGAEFRGEDLEKFECLLGLARLYAVNDVVSFKRKFQFLDCLRLLIFQSLIKSFVAELDVLIGSCGVRRGD